MHSAINSAGLTDRQTEAIAWVYGVDLTQEKAAAIMGVTQQAVAKMADEAVEKIAVVYRRWDYGEVTCEYSETSQQVA
ncbi:sigma factor-like helix-turn-helix DNA-binding protein [Paenibacillus polymyxa]|uniref:sigma factor-like helix-turn-helix DNA-binding protein n=1 Tax=Paenibacillus polymyxa TaxID=1406 RepID=UPI001F2EBDC3|nr:sigma factor-like helix-turn-helix DNA-binding protein [Paenibacillus polymyxa]